MLGLVTCNRFWVARRGILAGPWTTDGQTHAATVFSFTGTAHAFSPTAESFRGTMTYSPESAVRPDDGYGCYVGLVSYDIRLASGARIQGGLPEANFADGCWYGEIYDEIPDTDLTVPGTEFEYFAELLFWDFGAISDPLSPEVILAALTGSYWEMLFVDFDFEGPERYAYGIVDSASIVPEPTTLAILLLGLLMILPRRYRGALRSLVAVRPTR